MRVREVGFSLVSYASHAGSSPAPATLTVLSTAGMAEWLCSGFVIRLRGFDSYYRLWTTRMEFDSLSACFGDENVEDQIAVYIY